MVVPANDLGAAIFIHPWDMIGMDLMKKYWMPWYVAHAPIKMIFKTCRRAHVASLQGLTSLTLQAGGDASRDEHGDMFAHDGWHFRATPGSQGVLCTWRWLLPWDVGYVRVLLQLPHRASTTLTLSLFPFDAVCCAGWAVLSLSQHGSSTDSMFALICAQVSFKMLLTYFGIASFVWCVTT